ncbi:coenzyme F420-0:L-glutamate ligase [Candidatus Hecatella orcuttiae]|jgi:coenzyme F420-0:L-glutamate ligase/coenzyme F420-1:gamma-L-glutamate ligase|uniref:coenzyme F420-0:L-glutamate ligase n=1 Tax=Candidatus Hecatella orcuttiae TaxID=1935119 RepID=UPI002867D25F|nr:coenzyme F420-0:L-glutamate ligase [Candidatus Hecatella orcuttiae]
MPSPRKIEIIPIPGMPLVKPGDDVAALIWKTAKKQRIRLEDGDIIVVAQVVISKAEGSVVRLKSVKPSAMAEIVAERIQKPVGMAEIILQEAKSIVRFRRGHLITQTRHGLICANSGVDLSNVSGGDAVATLPRDPDASARKLREQLMKLSGKKLAVIITDTFGRPFRMGQVNVAIGVAGLRPIHDRKGEKDLFGYTLKVKEIAVADELASAGELLMGEAAEALPVVVIRGYPYQESEDAGAGELVRPAKYDLFI